MLKTLILSITLLALIACSDDNADSLGVAAQCTVSDDCNTENGQECLLDFKGGYCGIEGCLRNLDCPADAACVAHDNGTNYCFRTCTDKAQCNENRDAENEANCSSNITFVDNDQDGVKACVPPSA